MKSFRSLFSAVMAITLLCSLVLLLDRGELPAVDERGLLDLTFFYLTSLNGLGNIPNIDMVTELTLDDNQLVVLPENLGQILGNLRILRLDNNELIKFPNDFGQGLNNLRELYLRGNRIPLREIEKIRPNLSARCRIDF